MSHILLLGDNQPLLEGLAQTFASLGLTPVVADSIGEGRELMDLEPPLVILADRTLATGTEPLNIRLAPGGALVLYRSASSQPATPLTYTVQRTVMADLALPLERNRLVTLVQHVEQRARVTGRAADAALQPVLRDD
jgi:DNA-binding NtrC family response regulator